MLVSGRDPEQKGGVTSSSKIPPLIEAEAQLKTRKSIGKKEKNGTQNQDLLCWRGPKAI
jgi:hypothetical protein